MRACGVHTYDDYRALLDRSPGEYERLRDALTINVTRFYRNAETWNLLRRDVLPVLLDAPRIEVRVWSAGCASGEEPYTLAMLAADHLDRAGRGDELARLTVDATDIDRASLDRAQAARIGCEGLSEMPPELVRALLRAGRTRAPGRGSRPPSGRRSDRSTCSREAAAPHRLRPHPLPQRGDLLRSADAGAAVPDLRRRAGARRLS